MKANRALLPLAVAFIIFFLSGCLTTGRTTLIPIDKNTFNDYNGATFNTYNYMNWGELNEVIPWIDDNVSDQLTVEWTGLTDYPAGCNAGEAVQVIGDTLTCIPVSSGTVSSLQDLNDVFGVLYDVNKVLVADGNQYNEQYLSHYAIEDIGTNNHYQIDSHLASTSNPHSVTAAQADAVALTGNESIDGTKTFTSSPKVPNPTDDADAVPKGWFDTFTQGLETVASVYVATTEDINLNGWQVVDGVSITTGLRILNKNDSNATLNGIYISSSGAWTRATDYDTNAEIRTGTYTFVEYGTQNMAELWAMITPEPITVGVSDINWTQIGAPTVYGAGQGIILNGSIAVSIDENGGLMFTDLNKLKVSYDNNKLGIVDSNLTVLPSSITDYEISGAIGATHGGTGLSSICPQNQVLAINTTGTAWACKDLNAGTNITISSTDSSITFNAAGVEGAAEYYVSSFPFHSHATSSYALSNMAVALTALTSSIRTNVDLTGASEYRLVLNQAVKGSVNARILARYSLNNSTFYDLNSEAGAYVDINGTGVRYSDWVDMPANAKQQVWIQLYSIGGNAVEDPAFREMHLQVRYNASILTGGTSNNSYREITFHQHPASALAYANMPAALNELINNTRNRQKANLSNVAYYRFVVNQAVAGYAGADIDLQCSLNGSTWQAADILGAGEVDVGTGTGQKYGAFASLENNCKGDVWLRLVSKEGNGVVDPSWYSIKLQMIENVDVNSATIDAENYLLKSGFNEDQNLSIGDYNFSANYIVANGGIILPDLNSKMQFHDEGSFITAPEDNHLYLYGDKISLNTNTDYSMTLQAETIGAFGSIPMISFKSNGFALGTGYGAIRNTLIVYEVDQNPTIVLASNGIANGSGGIKYDSVEKSLDFQDATKFRFSVDGSGDIELNFDSTGNDGKFTWMNDENYFYVDNNVVIGEGIRAENLRIETTDTNIYTYVKTVGAFGNIPAFGALSPSFALTDHILGFKDSLLVFSEEDTNPIIILSNSDASMFSSLELQTSGTDVPIFHIASPISIGNGDYNNSFARFYGAGGYSDVNYNFDEDYFDVESPIKVDRLYVGDGSNADQNIIILNEGSTDEERPMWGWANSYFGDSSIEGWGFSNRLNEKSSLFITKGKNDSFLVAATTSPTGAAAMSLLSTQTEDLNNSNMWILGKGSEDDGNYFIIYNMKQINSVEYATLAQSFSSNGEFSFGMGDSEASVVNLITNGGYNIDEVEQEVGLRQSANLQDFLRISAKVLQTGTGGFRILEVDANTELNTGTGDHTLAAFSTNGLEKFKIEEDGDVNSTGALQLDGIITTPQTYIEAVGSNPVAVYIDDTGKLGIVPSSESAKENISYNVNSDWLYNLKPASYEYIGNDKNQIGLIAEDVAEVAPELVAYKIEKVITPYYVEEPYVKREFIDGKLKETEAMRTVKKEKVEWVKTDELLTVNYNSPDMITSLLDAIQKQKLKIDALEERIKKLEDVGAMP